MNLPEFEVRTVDLGGREQFSKEYTAINPNQKIPALVDGDRNIMESCAVLLYLAEKFPSPLMPRENCAGRSGCSGGRNLRCLATNSVTPGTWMT